MPRISTITPLKALTLYRGDDEDEVEDEELDDDENEGNDDDISRASFAPERRVEKCSNGHNTTSYTGAAVAVVAVVVAVAVVFVLLLSAVLIAESEPDVVARLLVAGCEKASGCFSILIVLSCDDEADDEEADDDEDGCDFGISPPPNTCTLHPG